MLAWLETLKAELGIPKSIREAGVQEADFLANVDKLSEDAFDDRARRLQPALPADLPAETNPAGYLLRS
ncbi:hypothetical protein ACLK15_07125 [Escherichia coli]